MSTKSEYIGLRTTSLQRDLWEEAAKADQRTLVDWIRTRLDRIAEAELKAKEEK